MSTKLLSVTLYLCMGHNADTAVGQSTLDPKKCTFADMTLTQTD